MECAIQKHPQVRSVNHVAGYREKNKYTRCVKIEMTSLMATPPNVASRVCWV